MNSATLLERATVELLSVSRSELAGLLRRAARRGFARSAAARLHPSAEGSIGVHASRAAALRHDVRRELARARSAGLLLSRAARRTCVALATLREGDWPAAALLARASLDLQETESGRVALGRGLLAAGRHGEGEAILAACYERGASPAETWPICEGLGWAAEERSRARGAGAHEARARALGWYVRALRAGAPAEVFVSARCVALERGASDLVEHFERRLAARLANHPEESERVHAVERSRAAAFFERANPAVVTVRTTWARTA